MLARAGIFTVPDGSEMIPEAEAARLHRQVRRDEPALAPTLLEAAGTRTAEYILSHRLPRPVQTMLRLLPAGPAAWILSRAIDRHAWTFAGSGRFRVEDPWTFEIRDNPLIRGERSDMPLCVWHSAVFARLYRALVHPDCQVTETACGAIPGHGACRFEIRLRRV